MVEVKVEVEAVVEVVVGAEVVVGVRVEVGVDMTPQQEANFLRGECALPGCTEKLTYSGKNTLPIPLDSTGVIYCCPAHAEEDLSQQQSEREESHHANNHHH